MQLLVCSGQATSYKVAICVNQEVLALPRDHANSVCLSQTAREQSRYQPTVTCNLVHQSRHHDHTGHPIRTQENQTSSNKIAGLKTTVSNVCREREREREIERERNKSELFLTAKLMQETNPRASLPYTVGRKLRQQGRIRKRPSDKDITCNLLLLTLTTPDVREKRTKN